ncbi:PIN domain-containing protein [Melioribacter sp. OK-6-Me]|uniref:PIN domain-containing protein n=1 Tax=unclassified Melioribacter TaxID=2627329 RepID=UPI003ED92E8E
MENKREHYLIDTDILIEYLESDASEDSILEILMRRGICFTTVINSAELFFNSNNQVREEAVKRLLSALKVLGLNSRYSLNISKFFNKVAGVREALICSVALNNKLPLVTRQVEKYSNSGIEIIDAAKIKTGR